MAACSFGRRSGPRKGAPTPFVRVAPSQSPLAFLGCYNGFAEEALPHRPRTCALPISSWSSRCLPAVSLAQTNSRLSCQTSILRGSSPPLLACPEAHFGEYSRQTRQCAFLNSAHGSACRDRPSSWAGSFHADEESLVIRECGKSLFGGHTPCVAAARRYVDSGEREGPVQSRSLRRRRHREGPPSKTHIGSPS